MVYCQFVHFHPSCSHTKVLSCSFCFQKGTHPKLTTGPSTSVADALRRPFSLSAEVPLFRLLALHCRCVLAVHLCVSQRDTMGLVDFWRPEQNNYVAHWCKNWAHPNKQRWYIERPQAWLITVNCWCKRGMWHEALACILTLMGWIKFPIIRYFHGFVLERLSINQMYIV